MLQHSSSIDISSRLANFMSRYAEANVYDQREIDELREMFSMECDIAKVEMLCLKLFNSDWIFMPHELAIPLLRRFIELNGHNENSQLLLGKWLMLFGMEYENNEEGICLLKNTVEGRRIIGEIEANSNTKLF